ncbi:MAG: methylenetetrahydrofolate--tRNA-(uracil(54)-C(5))-methyltransferase (FADH(2)-oxidizing) TrmFO [Candidatus Methylacidiphilales bacterium]
MNVTKSDSIVVIGAGLAGAEAAWQAAQMGCRVDLFEMRPGIMTPAHQTAYFGELVCSNSLGSKLPDRATGMLRAEMELLDSVVVRCAEAHAVPAGGALAVDREGYGRALTEAVSGHPLISVHHEELRRIPDHRVVVVASGPLTTEALSADIQRITGEDALFFFDALSPIVEAETINLTICYRASRHLEAAEGDYLNCPFNEDQYKAFVRALCMAERIEMKDFERREGNYFEGCLPVEVLAERGEDALRFGPMRPVGLDDPRTGRWPYAVVQLRQDNAAGSLYNLVGFQTNIRWGEQENILRMIPGLEKAEFVRLGQMHRNTFIQSPRLLRPTMEMISLPGLFFAGQIVGVEGYLGNAASGLLAGRNAARRLRGIEPQAYPKETMLGALANYVSHADPKYFQPMKANFGIMPELASPIKNKRLRYQAYVNRGLEALNNLLQSGLA